MLGNSLISDLADPGVKLISAINFSIASFVHIRLIEDDKMAIILQNPDCSDKGVFPVFSNKELYYFTHTLSLDQPMLCGFI